MNSIKINVYVCSRVVYNDLMTYCECWDDKIMFLYAHKKEVKVNDIILTTSSEMGFYIDIYINGKKL